MSVLQRILALISLALSTSDACAQANLQWKFAKGQIYYAQRITTQKQTVTVNGKEFEQTRESVWHVRLDVKEQMFESFVIQATLAKVEHHVVGAVDAQVMDPKLQDKQQGSIFTLHVAPTGLIQEMRGYEEFLQRLAGTDKARRAALQTTLSEATVKEAFADLFGPLPASKVQRGDSWRREVFEPIPHFGGLRSSVVYVHDGGDKERERIVYTIQTKYEAPKKDGTSLFHVRDGTIESDKAHGEIDFDRAGGRLIAHSRSMLLQGRLTIEALDRRQTLDFSSVNGVKIRVQLTGS